MREVTILPYGGYMYREVSDDEVTAETTANGIVEPKKSTDACVNCGEWGRCICPPKQAIKFCCYVCAGDYGTASILADVMVCQSCRRKYL